MALGIEVDAVVAVTALPSVASTDEIPLHVVTSTVPVPTLSEGRPV